MAGKLIFISTYIFLITLVCLAQDSPRALYDQGKYQEVIDGLNSQGMQTAADYFNAGNAYFKLGRPGQAISFYSKAAAIAPNDADIRYNLALAEDAAQKSGSYMRDQSLWNGTIHSMARRIPETYVDLLLALCTAALALVSFRSKKQGLRFMPAIVQPGFLTVLAIWSFACAATTLVIMAHHVKQAAVLADVTSGRSGPGETFTELFKVPAGTTLELTGERRDGWRQVRFSLGNVGWIMEKDLLTL